MNVRDLTLRLLLAALAVATLAGALAPFLGETELLIRIALTGVNVAVAAGLVQVMARLVESPPRRTAGTVGLACAGLLFLLGLLLIWEYGLLGSWIEERVGLSMFVIAGTGAMIVAGLATMPDEPMRVAGRCLAVGGGLALLLCGTAVWIEDGDWRARLGALGMLTALHVGLIPVAQFIRPRGWWRSWWRRIGLVALAGAYAVWVVAMIDLDNPHDIVAPLSSIAVYAGIVNVLRLLPLRRGQAWVRVGVVAAFGVLATCLGAMPWLDDTDFDDTAARIAASAGLVGACGLVAMLVLLVMNRLAREPESGAALDSERRSVEIDCPRCGTRCRLVAGREAGCPECGLEMEIRLRVPHCPACGQAQYGASATRCPECGTRRQAAPAAEPA